MYLLTACAGSWVILCGSLAFSWMALPDPRSASDLAVIVIIAVMTLAFSRIGLLSLLTLLLRVLPNGQMRAWLLAAVLRTAPVLLRSSMLAAVSATLAVQTVHADPAQTGPAGSSPPEAAAGTTVAAPIDPSWPTISDSQDSPPDPGWPTNRAGSGRGSGEDADDQRQAEAPAESREDPGGAGNEGQGPEDARVPGDGSSPTADPPAQSQTTHVVEAGESLWTIAADLAASPARVGTVVDEIYTDNQDVIGPNPNLIMPGQRLETSS